MLTPAEGDTRLIGRWKLTALLAELEVSLPGGKCSHSFCRPKGKGPG